MKKLSFALISTALGATMAFGQANQVSGIYGLTATKSGALSYILSMDANQANDYFTVTGSTTHYAIQNVFGFFVDGSASSANSGAANGWKAQTISSLVGFTDNSKGNELAPGGASQTFTFSSLPANPVLAFHVTAGSNPPGFGSGPTFYIEGAQAAPEPSMLLGLLAPIAFVIRRRK